MCVVDVDANIAFLVECSATEGHHRARVVIGGSGVHRVTRLKVHTQSANGTSSDCELVIEGYVEASEVGHLLVAIGTYLKGDGA